MAGIAAINANNNANWLYYYYIYNQNSSLVSSLASTGATASTGSTYAGNIGQLSSLYDLMLLSGYATSQVAAQQDAYKTQIKDFTAAVRDLSASTGSLLGLPAAADAAKTVGTVNQFAASFNTLTQTIQGADNLTAAGRRLENSLQAAVQVRENDLKAIGIAYDSDSGELTVDELKLKQAIAADYGKVRETLAGTYGLGKAVDKAVSTAAATSVTDYLANPAATLASTYSLSWGSGLSTYYAALSRGLMLDMLV